jgi:hypothetical protein
MNIILCYNNRDFPINKDIIIKKSQTISDLICDTYETNKTVKIVSNRIDLLLDQIVEQENVTREQMCDIISMYLKYEMDIIFDPTHIFQSVKYFAAFFRFLDYMDDQHSIKSYLELMSFALYVPLCKHFNYNYGFNKSIHEYFSVKLNGSFNNFCSDLISHAGSFYYIGDSIDQVVFDIFATEPNYITKKHDSKILYYPFPMKSCVGNAIFNLWPSYHIPDQRLNFLKLLVYNPMTLFPVKYKSGMRIDCVTDELKNFYESDGPLMHFLLFGSIDGVIKMSDKYYKFNPSDYLLLQIHANLEEGDIVFVNFNNYKNILKTNQYIPICDQ